MKKKPLFFLFLILNFSNTLAGTDCHYLELNWYQTYTKEIRIDWDTREFICNSFEGEVAQAFYDIHDIKYRPNSSGYVPDFWAYVKANVRTVKYDKDCPHMAYAYDNTLTLCRAFMETNREDKASTLVHEARHMESDEPGHVPCVGGRHKGKAQGCDQKFHDGANSGSGYNADIFFYSWATKREDNDLSNAVLRSDIRAMVPERFNEITPEEIVKWRNW